MVLAKDWEWAALTLLALWLVMGNCPSGTPVLDDPQQIFTEEDGAEGRETAEPLKDEELEVEPAPKASVEAEEKIPWNDMGPIGVGDTKWQSNFGKVLGFNLNVGPPSVCAHRGPDEHWLVPDGPRRSGAAEVWRDVGVPGR